MRSFVCESLIGCSPTAYPSISRLRYHSKDSFALEKASYVSQCALVRIHLEVISMTFSSAPPPAPRRFPRWLIAVLALGSLVTLAFCGIVVIGVLTLLGSKVTPTTSVARGSTAEMIYDPRAN